MKKSILILILSAIYCTIQAQSLEVDSITGKLTCKSILEFDSIPKSKLFDKAKEWISLSYHDANSVIQNADKESGNIICKGNFATPIGLAMQNPNVSHTLIIDVKDGKIRVNFTDFVLNCTNCGREMPFDANNKGFYKNAVNRAADIVTTKCLNHFISISKYIKSSITKKDEW